MNKASWLGLAAVLWAGVPSQGATTIRFNRDIRPILADHCFTCHGQDEKTRKSGLRLDRREAALQGGKSGQPAIVPGRPEASELVARVSSHDADEVMPPKKEGKPLTAAQIERLRRWVSEGAEYQGHWAFLTPERPPLPEGGTPRQRIDGGAGGRPKQRAGFTVRTPIDSFVSARLQAEKLTPSFEATPEVLIRRVSLDLTGLPPSPREVDEFVRAWGRDGERAYGELVERLLASPHFGEKWARHWLDAARYADSDGYEKDLPRSQWPWRDWVIGALNADMPYDRFIIEQLAGDLLPHATQEQRVAAGFLRNGMVNEEGAILAEQFRMEGMFDRMDCLGKAVLGLTLQCAQCHSHKFDPLTQEEYYRLFAYLNNDYEAQSWVYRPEPLQQIEQIHRETARLEEQLKAAHPDWPQQLASWAERERQAELTWHTLDPSEYEWEGGLCHPQRLPDHSVLTLGFRPTSGELWVVATNLPALPWTGLRLEALTHGDLPFDGPGRSAKGTFAISELIAEARTVGSTNRWKKLAFTNATADFAQADQPIEAFYRKGSEDKRRVGPPGYLIDGKEETAWGADRGPGRRHQPLSWVGQFVPTNAWPTGAVELKVMLKYRHGGADDHGRQNQFLGRFRLSVTTDPAPVADPLPPLARQALRVPSEQRSPAQQAALFTAWRESVRRHADAQARSGGPAEPGAAALRSAVAEVDRQITALWERYPEGETVLTLAQREPEWARDTFLLERGGWDKPQGKVSAGVPAFLHSVPADAPPSRLTLARWLVDRRSPTTARVWVNRVWQTIFGLGLVETPEDFGVRAPLPIHPELLDWLAVEFMSPEFQPSPAASGLAGSPSPPRSWSLKHLLRLIVTSSTYRQDSRVTPELLERDPRNQFLARAPRFRAEAEVVRDIALAASGLLHDRVGGPSFYPPVPESMFAFNFVKLDWPSASAPERYRRSLYMFRRRSMPDPVMGSFDAPNADSACVRRVRSNTPLAALTSLNEPVFVEAARALAMRVLQEGGSTDTERAAYAFRLCASRTPKPAETSEILNLLRSRTERLAAGWVPPKDIAFGSADKMPALPSGVTPTQAAAWTIVARVLLNLDETVTKN